MAQPFIQPSPRPSVPLLARARRLSPRVVDGVHDPLPHRIAVHVTIIEHLGGPLDGDDIRVVAMLVDEELRCAVYVDVVSHSLDALHPAARASASDRTTACLLTRITAGDKSLVLGSTANGGDRMSRPMVQVFAATAVVGGSDITTSITLTT